MGRVIQNLLLYFGQLYLTTAVLMSDHNAFDGRLWGKTSRRKSMSIHV